MKIKTEKKAIVVARTLHFVFNNYPQLFNEEESGDRIRDKQKVAFELKISVRSVYEHLETCKYKISQEPLLAKAIWNYHRNTVKTTV